MVLVGRVWWVCETSSIKHGTRGGRGCMYTAATFPSPPLPFSHLHHGGDALAHLVPKLGREGTEPVVAIAIGGGSVGVEAREEEGVAPISFIYFLGFCSIIIKTTPHHTYETHQKHQHTTTTYLLATPGAPPVDGVTRMTPPTEPMTTSLFPIASTPA